MLHHRSWSSVVVVGGRRPLLLLLLLLPPCLLLLLLPPTTAFPASVGGPPPWQKVLSSFWPPSSSALPPEERQNQEVIRTQLLPALQTLIDNAQPGRDPSAYQTEIVAQMLTIGKLRNRNLDQRQVVCPSSASSSSASSASSSSWELIYTTEREINFFQSKLWTTFGGAAVTSIEQHLDLYTTHTIQNTIAFGTNGGLLAVTGSVQPAKAVAAGETAASGETRDGAPYDRIDFAFTSARIVAFGRSFENLPPIGAGWFETLYCDQDYRLSRDSRNDYSVFRRLPVSAAAAETDLNNGKNNNKNISSDRRRPQQETAPSNGSPPGGSVSRRDLFWKVPIGVGGAVAYANLMSEAYQRVTRGDFVYPEAHEQRVRATIETAILASIQGRNPLPNSSGSSVEEESLPFVPSISRRPLRILEVGIGTECRLLARGLYNPAFAAAATAAIAAGSQKIDLIGVDRGPPPTAPTRDRITQQFFLNNNTDVQSTTNIDGSFDYVQGNIETGLAQYDDGSFDCILCSFLLCSVENPVAAVTEIQRLLRPDGGTFGYIEHVAVNPDEPYKLLRVQQQVLNPLQNLLADQCNLNRQTEATIHDVFGINDDTTTTTMTMTEEPNTALAPAQPINRAKIITGERFLVPEMWPISCQACGVIQRIS